MEVWLTVDEVAELVKISVQAVRKNASNGKYKSITEEFSGQGAVKKRYLIALSSLPYGAQVIYRKKHGLTDESNSLNQNDQPVVNLALIQSLPGGDQELRLYNRKLKAVKEALRIQGSGKNIGKRLDDLSEEYGISVKTLYGWLDAYKNQKEMGLLKKQHQKLMLKAPGGEWTPEYGGDAFGPAALNFLQNQFLDKDKPKRKYAYNMTVDESKRRISAATTEEEQLELKTLWAVGSYQTACRFIKSIPEAPTVLYREGKEAYRNKVMPKTEMDYSNMLINEWFMGDGHQLDIFADHNGKAVRLWLSAWQDAKSKALVGWCLSEKANADTIGLALRHSALRKPDSPICGLPANVYIDNGKDYQGKHLAGGLKHAWKFDYSEVELGVFASLGIDVKYCTARSPWAKGGMERSFRTIEEQHLYHLPGYCGSDNKARPEGFDEKKLLKQGKLLKTERLVKVFEEIVNEYNNTVHSKLKATPLEVYQSVPKAREGVPDPRALDVLLMKAEKRKVNSQGVMLNGRVYYHDELALRQGEHVSVRYNPNDLSEVLVIQEGRLICVAQENLTAFGDKEALELNMARQKRAMRAARSFKTNSEDRLLTVEAGYTGAILENRSGDMITGFEQVAKDAAAEKLERTEPPALPKKVSLLEKWMEKQGKKALGL